MDSVDASVAVHSAGETVPAAFRSGLVPLSEIPVLYDDLLREYDEIWADAARRVEAAPELARWKLKGVGRLFFSYWAESFYGGLVGYSLNVMKKLEGLDPASLDALQSMNVIALARLERMTKWSLISPGSILSVVISGGVLAGLLRAVEKLFGAPAAEVLLRYPSEALMVVFLLVWGVGVPLAIISALQFSLRAELARPRFCHGALGDCLAVAKAGVTSRQLRASP